MKKHLSVLALYAGNTFLRLLALMIAMGALETALFALHWNRWEFVDGNMPAVENLLVGLPLVSAMTLLALLFLICLDDGKTTAASYSLRRLRIPEEAAILWRAVYNGICLLLLWAVQTAVALGLCSWYARAIGPEYSSSLTVFLAFYRVPFLHNLLPLGCWLRYLRNIVLLLALGFCAAVRTYKLRRGSQYGWGIIVFLWGVTYTSFRVESLMDIVSIIAALIAVIVDADYFIKGWTGWRGGLDETD